MLNTEQIAEFIIRPELMRSEDVEILRELSEKHPYSSVYSLLYLQGVSRFQSVHLDEVLPKQAYKLSDRTRLFHLLHSAFESLAVTEHTASSVEPLNVNENEKPVFAAETTLVVETVQEEKQNEKQNENEEVIPEPISEPAEKDIFDFETVAAALSQDYLAQNEKENQNEESEEEVPDEVGIEEQSYTEPPVDAEVSSINTEPEKVIVAPSEIDQKRSFTSWLKAGDHSAEEKAPLSKTKASSGKDEKLQEKAEEPKTDIKSAQQEIIDKFIETSPSMPKPKTEFYSPSKKAKESLDDERIPVSETLAKIYAAQGNFPKAIHVYHQLSLAFPEKKSLFALQIDELKKKITS